MPIFQQDSPHLAIQLGTAPIQGRLQLNFQEENRHRMAGNGDGAHVGQDFRPRFPDAGAVI